MTSSERILAVSDVPRQHPWWRFNPKGAWKDRQRRRLLREHAILPDEAATAGPVILLGQGSGAWPVAESELPQDPSVWSFGVGKDLSFEIDLLERYGGSVHAFDPTPRSLAWVTTQDLPSTLHVHDYGLARVDGVAWFAPPRKERGVDFSSASADTPGAISLPVLSLDSIRLKVGLAPDYLKVDIEGGEKGLISEIVSLGAPQVAIEFHHGMYGVKFSDTLHALEIFASAGYRIAWISTRGLEFLFVRTG